MDQLIFQEYPDLDRIRILESNAVEQKDGYRYERVLSDEDVAERETEFAEKHIEIAKLEQEKADYVAKMNAQIKELKTVANQKLDQIKTRREDTTGKVYVLHDELDQRVGIYSPHGELISERPMKKEERQHRLQFSTKDYTVSVVDKEGNSKVV